MEVQSISWQRGTTGPASSADFTNFRIYLGYCAEDMLSTTFEDNYIPLSRTLVRHADSQNVTAEEGDWFTIPLDSPFWYNGVDNLVMEVIWDSGTGNPSVYEFNTPMTPVSLKSASSSGETGFLSSNRCQFMLEGVQELSPNTFAGVKIVLGEE